MRAFEFLGPDGDLYRLGHVMDPPSDGEGWVRLSERDAASMLRSAAQRRAVEARLGALLEVLHAPRVFVEHHSPAVDAIEWAVDELLRPAGLLVLWHRPQSRPVLTGSESLPPEPLSDLAGGSDEQEHTWIAFRLLDLHGQPIPDVAYELTLGDGSVEQGSTDGNGEVRHEGIVRGSCTLVFPDLPERYWETAHNAES